MPRNTSQFPKWHQFGIIIFWNWSESEKINLYPPKTRIIIDRKNVNDQVTIEV